MTKINSAETFFTPEPFKPDNQFLLKADQWQQIQLSLIDFLHLPLSKDAVPQSVRLIYTDLYQSAMKFSFQVLPDAFRLGTDLYNYGRMAAVYYNIAIKRLDANPPDWKNIIETFIELRNKAKTCQDNAQAVSQLSAELIQVFLRQQRDLTTVIQTESDTITTDENISRAITDDINAQMQRIQDAKQAIARDLEDMNSAVYYSWLPLAGTIAGAVKVTEDKKDIERNQQIMREAAEKISEDEVKLNSLEHELIQMRSLLNINNQLQADFSKIMPMLPKIEDAWSTISTELDAIASNLIDIEFDIPILVSNLVTAISEWHDVANDANNYTTNFHVIPATNQ